MSPLNLPHGTNNSNNTHTHQFNSPLSVTTRVSRYQKGKTNLDFTEARDSEWQWHQLGHMQVCTSLQTDNHASTPSLSFLQAWCPSCRPTNSVKARQRNQQHKSGKQNKTKKVKTDMLRSISKQSGESVLSVLKKAMMGRICGKGRF